MRLLIAACFTVFGLLYFSFPAFAVEDVPGDSCAGITAHSFRWAGGPENGGVVNGLFCESNTWSEAINFQSSGRVGIGTTTPGSPLEVDTSTASYSIYAYNSKSGGRGLLGEADTGSGIGVFATSASTGSGTGVLATESGASNTGYAVQLTNNSATGWGLYSNGTSPSYFSGSVGIGTTAPGSLLDIGLAGTTLGTLRLEGSTSGYVQLQPAAAAGSWTMTLPPNAGTSGYVLRTDGAGVTTWVAQSGGAALSGLTAATAGNTIANANFAQVWNWDTLTTGTALTLGSTSMTTGKLLALSNTNATSAGNVLDVRNAQAASGAYAIYAAETGATGITTGIEGESDSTTAGATGITGYEGGATGATRGVYARDDSTTDTASALYAYEGGATGATYGVYGSDASTTTGAAAGYFTETGASGATVGVYGTTASTTGGAAGVEGADWATTGATYGVYGVDASTTTGAAAGFFTETGASGVTVGVYGSTASTTGGAAGVQGADWATTGATYGVYGVDASTTAGAKGVVGTATGTTGATYGVYGTDASATGFGGYFTNTNGGYALATGSGNVGIGTNSPAAKLHVIGDIRYTGVIVDVSDRLLKTDIRPLPPGQLAKMMQLQPVSFVMKDDPKHRTELGLIAQDTEPLYPDLVQTDPDGSKSLGYVGLVSPLIKAMQEQQAEIDHLRAGLAIVFCIALVPGFLLWRNRAK